MYFTKKTMFLTSLCISSVDKITVSEDCIFNQYILVKVNIGTFNRICHFHKILRNVCTKDLKNSKSNEVIAIY